MTINPKKTKDMWICFNSAILEPDPLLIGSDEEERVKCHKLLGVWHQNNLKWNLQGESIVKKANKSERMLQSESAFGSWNNMLRIQDQAYPRLCCTNMEWSPAISY